MAKLQDCGLNVDVAASYPFMFGRPEEAWESSLAAGRIPTALFDFYCAAKYFSLEAAPKFLRGTDGLLFFYLKALINGIRESFEDAAALLEQLKVAEANQYTPSKRLKGENWDPAAAQIARRTPKYIFAEVAGALDQTAEVAAVLFGDEIPRVPIGRADFAALVKVAKERGTGSGSSAIVTPRAGKLEDLCNRVREEVAGSGTEEDWFELFQLYRNKFAHIGNYMFPTVGLPAKSSDDFHAFLPNHWPAPMEQHITTLAKPGTRVNLATFFEAEYIHQDLVEYAERLVKRARDVIGSLFIVLLESYKLFSEMETDLRAIEALNRQGQRWRFRGFVD
jgi:hypothetical protein